MLKKKSLGQNFLRSKAALAAIIDAGGPTPDDIVLEIGPGEGALTAELLKFAGKVIAIEKDSRLTPILKEKFEKEIKCGKLDVVEADVLELGAESLELRGLNSKLKPLSYKLIANIPYYITGQVLRKFLESGHQPQSMTLLVQKEVAERIVAKDGKESLLSISVKAYGEPKYVKTVPRGAFSPMPKVDSAIIHIDLTPLAPLKLRGGPNPNNFFQILKKGFGHKRKLLIKNLENSSKGTFWDRGSLKVPFKKCGLSEKARAEDLKIEDWVCLTKALS